MFPYFWKKIQNCQLYLKHTKNQSIWFWNITLSVWLYIFITVEWPHSKIDLQNQPIMFTYSESRQNFTTNSTFNIQIRASKFLPKPPKNDQKLHGEDVDLQVDRHRTPNDGTHYGHWLSLSPWLPDGSGNDFDRQCGRRQDRVTRWEQHKQAVVLVEWK